MRREKSKKREQQLAQLVNSVNNDNENLPLLINNSSNGLDIS